MKRIFTLLFITLFIGSIIRAEATFTVSAPQRVVVGDNFYVTFTLTGGEAREPKVAPVDGFKLLYGPSVSYMSNSQYINGRQTSNTKIQYTYYYKGEKEGEFKIGAASINVNGKTLSTQAQKIVVVANPNDARSGGGNSKANIYDLDSQTSDKAVSASDVMVRIILNKKTAYEQEGIECIIKLYTKYSISSFLPTKQPSFDGFLIDEVNIKSSLNAIETYNGEDYYTAILKKCIIFPQQSGNLTINSGEYDISVIQYDNINMGLFPVPIAQEKDIKVSSNSAKIDVKALPSPKPSGFTGAVGKFNIESDLSSETFRTNEPITLTYTITGEGNIKYLKDPEIEFPDDFEQYSPDSKVNTRVVNGNVSGTKTIEYTFVPQSVGDFHIAGYNFIYFNPETKEYVTVETPSYDLKVSKGVSTPTYTEKKDISVKNEDILHIKTGDLNLSKSTVYYISVWWYWLIYLLLILILIGTILTYRKKIALSNDIEGGKLARANKVARKRLAEAKSYLSKNDEDKFYDATLRALWGYLGDKLRIPASSLTRDNIAAELTKYGAPENLTENIIKLLDECEMARYSKADMRPSMDDIYKSATSAINEMETLKIKRK